ncbi:DUF4142 domain-containing protein [Streptomyces sp. NPDC002990]
MHSRFLTAAVISLAVTGLSVPQAMAASAAAPAVVGSQDVAFATMAHQGNLAEIAAGQDAQKNATTSCVKEVGAVLVRDHNKLDADLATLAKQEGITLPTAPTAEQRAALADVQSKAGSRAYDQAWLAVQQDAHTKTLGLIDQEIRQGQDPDVIQAARDARPVVAMHLDMVRGGTCNRM